MLILKEPKKMLQTVYMPYREKNTRGNAGKELLFKHCMSSSYCTFILDENLCVFPSGSGSAFFKGEELQSIYSIKDAIRDHQNLALLVFLSSVEKWNLRMTLWYGFASITSLYLGPTTHSPWIKAANFNSIKQCPVLLPKQCRGAVPSCCWCWCPPKGFLERERKSVPTSKLIIYV